MKNPGAGNLPDDGDANQPEQGSIESVDSPPQDNGGVEDTPDGGAIVNLGDSQLQPADKGNFYDNLIDTPVLDMVLLGKLSLEFDERIREDKKAFEQRVKQYAEGIKRTGLGNEAPGGAQFVGASKVVHPVLIKAAIDFEARAIAELMPPAGAVKEYIPNPEITQVQADKARRVAAHMNWQLTKQMPEFRPELEQMLSQVSLGGSQFMYLNWDEKRRRPMPTYWPSDDVIIPYGASNAFTAERLTMVERITQRAYEQRFTTGYYKGNPDAAPVMQPERTEAAKAAEKVEGKEPDILNKDGLREVWRVFTDLEIPGDPFTKGELAPYVIEMNENRSGINRVIRNWEEKDELRLPMQWLVEFPFLPWRGALSIGLAHVIGTLSGAATGALRALLDSAHVNNFPAVLKLKGANFGGQTTQMEFGTMVDIEGGVAGLNDDIRKLTMPIPYNPPSTVLFQLLGFLGDEAEAVVQTTLKNLGDAASNTLPVGTTLALIEQGMKVFAGVHQRLLHAMTQLLQVLYRINKMYMTDQELKDDAGTVLASRRDYNGPMDVIPVGDPNIFSDAQRFAQMQVVADRATQKPDLYDARKVEEGILKMTRIPDATSYLQPSQQPDEMNAVNENTAMAMGRPVMAYPEQDHLAHLQVLLDFARSPVLGQLPNIAPKFMELAIDHAGQHVALWYASAMYHAGSAAVEQKLELLMNTKDPEANKELDRLLATISPAAVKAANQHFGTYQQILAELQQIADKYKPQPQGDNSTQVAQIGAETAKAVAGQRSQDVASTNQSREKVVSINAATRLQELRAKQQGDAGKTQATAAQNLALQTQKDNAAGQRQQDSDRVKVLTNEQDNSTALTIAASELAAGHKADVSTGTGVNPGGGK
jgi:hypothetical protein